jgi:hypothetical protein
MTQNRLGWLTRHRFLFLLISLLAVAILIPILYELDLTRARFFLNVFVTIVLLFSVYAISENKKVFIGILCLAVLAIGARWATYFVQELSTAFIVTAIILLAACLFSVTVTILFSVLKAGRVTGEKISAAVCVYLLIGVLWAYLFTLTYVLNPGAFRLEGPEFQDFIYYSYVTLTTLGYGDIAPLTPTVRALAYVEAIIGQIYLTVLIARLVALHIADARKE